MHVYLLIDPRTEAPRYVGITKYAIERRLKQHIGNWKRGFDYPVCRWMRKLSDLSLVPRIILVEETDDPDRERYWVRSYRQQGCDLLNCNDGGQGLHPRSEETRRKLSAGTKGQKRTPEQRQRMSEAQKGKHSGFKHTEETKARMRKPKPPGFAEKLSAAKTGQKMGPITEERRRKLSAALKGRKQSPEHTAKVAAAQKGKIISAESRAKMSAAHIGQSRPLTEAHRAAFHSPEARAKAAASNTGQKRAPHTPEAKAKMSASRKGKATRRIYGPVSEETKAKLRAANLGKKKGPPSEETRAKIAAANRGHCHPPEVLARIAAKNRGRKWTEEQKANLRKVRQAQRDRAQIVPSSG